jgi:hypothetical protein
MDGSILGNGFLIASKLVLTSANNVYDVINDKPYKKIAFWSYRNKK